MNERRHLARKLADQLLCARDVNTGHTLGRVVNLSHAGLMLINTKPVDPCLVFQLELIVKHAVPPCCLPLGVESLWCAPAQEPGCFWTGYRIIDISPATIQIIATLVDDWDIDANFY